MNGTDNIAGYSLTVGTADMVITDSVGQYDPIIGNLADGDERSYKIQFIDSSMSTDYETGTGTWNESLATFSRDTIKTSSNGGSIVSFGAGPKVLFIVDDYDSIQSMGTKFETADAKVMTAAERATIAGLGDSSSLDVGTVAGTVAAGDDSRFGSVDIGDLTPATSIDGTELFPADQGGDGVSITADQIHGDPYRAKKSLALDRTRGFTLLDGLHPTDLIVDNTLAGNEKFVIRAGGAGAAAANNQGTVFVPSLLLSTGTTNTGYCAAQHTSYPYLFVPGTSDLDQRWAVSISNLPTAGVQDFTIQIGFSTASTAVQGMYFEASGANANWQKVVKDGAGTTTVDTGVAVTTAATIFRVAYSPIATETQFWINGTALSSIDDTTRAVDLFAVLGMFASITKTAGATARYMTIFAHSYDNAKDAIPDFE